MSDLDRLMHRSLWAEVAHSSFTEGSHMTKNTASGQLMDLHIRLYVLLIVIRNRKYGIAECDCKPELKLRIEEKGNYCILSSIVCTFLH